MSVYEVATRRRTIRRFKDVPVPLQILERCVNAARLAPSAANLQPLEYLVVNHEQLLPKVFSTLNWAMYIRPAGDPPEGKRPQAYIVILRDSNITTQWAPYDVGLAIENIVLVALEEGVGSCILGGVDREKLRGILNIPRKYEIPLVMALGYPDENPVEDTLAESVKYWKDREGVLHVPKRKLENVLHWNAI